MKLKFGFFAAGIAVGLAFSALAASAEIDRAALYKHLPKALPFPPGVEFELKDLKPSAIPGFLTGTLEGRYKGQTQTWPIQITKDGRYYVLSDIYALSPSKIPGLMSPATTDPNIPQVHVTKDGSRFLFGEFQDAAVDPDKENLSKVHLSGLPYRGTAGAPVTIVEYSDLECPYCRNAHQILEKELLAAYGKKVRWYFKHDPLPGHPWSYSAAIAAACATRMKPEAGWKMEADFFNAQPDPTAPITVQQATEENLVNNIRAVSLGFAEKAGLNKARFETCYDKQESKAAVETDKQEAAALHLDSTPTFVINGRIVHGFRDFASFKENIDAMLAEKASKK